MPAVGIGIGRGGANGSEKYRSVICRLWHRCKSIAVSGCPGQRDDAAFGAGAAAGKIKTLSLYGWTALHVLRPAYEMLLHRNAAIHSVCHAVRIQKD